MLCCEASLEFMQGIHAGRFTPEQFEEYAKVLEQFFALDDMFKEAEHEQHPA
jgi:hypothetical protein